MFAGIAERQSAEVDCIQRDVERMTSVAECCPSLRKDREPMKDAEEMCHPADLEMRVPFGKGWTWLKDAETHASNTERIIDGNRAVILSWELIQQPVHLLYKT